MINYGVERQWNYRGYDCIVVKMKQGYRTGYIVVKKGHYLYNADMEFFPQIEVPYGFTYSGKYIPAWFVGIFNKIKAYFIYSDKWLIGFDCRHVVKNGDDYTLDLKSKNDCLDLCENTVDQIIKFDPDLR